MNLASFHSLDESMDVMQILYDSDVKENIWLGLIRNIKGVPN